MLDGRLSSIDPISFGRLLDDPPAGAVFLDVRKAAQADDYIAKWGDKGWMNIPQELLADRLADVPDSGPIYLVCNSGARSYEAQITLRGGRDKRRPQPGRRNGRRQADREKIPLTIN